MTRSFESFEEVAEYLKELKAKEEKEVISPRDRVCKNCIHAFGRHFDPDPPNWTEPEDYFFCRKSGERVDPFGKRDCFCQ